MSNKRIRVLQLGSPTGLYGAERWILALIKYLPRDEIESIVSVIKDDSKLKPELCDHAALLDINTHVIEAYGKLSLSAIGQLRKFIQQNNIDILHTHGYKTDIVGLLAIQGTACKIMTTPHGWTVNADFKLRFYELLDCLVFPFFDAIVPLSQQLCTTLTGSLGLKKKVVLIENGVDTDEIDDVTHIATEMSAWKCRGYSVIGYIGRLTPGKGLDVLLRAFAKLDHVTMRLAIVGDGEQLQELKEIAATMGIGDYVCFFGFRTDRIAFLRGFDLFVLPSRSEGTPRCVMEAMATGVPVIATDIPGCRELVDDNVTGMLFQVDDCASLTEKITRLLEDEYLRTSIGVAGQLLVRNKYSAKKMAARYVELYKALTKYKHKQHSDPQEKVTGSTK